jgi:hypothetical protein
MMFRGYLRPAVLVLVGCATQPRAPSPPWSPLATTGSDARDHVDLAGNSLSVDNELAIRLPPGWLVAEPPLHTSLYLTAPDCAGLRSVEASKHAMISALDEAVPLALCIGHVGYPGWELLGPMVFLRIYREPTASPEAIRKYLSLEFPRALKHHARSLMRSSVVAPGGGPMTIGVEYQEADAIVKQTLWIDVRKSERGGAVVTVGASQEGWEGDLEEIFRSIAEKRSSNRD